MSVGAKSKWQVEFEALPPWAQKMVRAAASCVSYGGGSSDLLAGLYNRKDYTAFHAAMTHDAYREWMDGFFELVDLANALTAPWPPPPPPPREKRVFNIVELAAEGDEEGGGFDQPCAFGNRVGGHATYCHNEAWPNSPRKCRRSQHNPEHRHEDCPGFVANPDADPEKSW